MKPILTLFFNCICILQTWASELFIQAQIPNRYTLTVADQTLTNGSGKFRFFDLQTGKQTVFVFNANTNDLILTYDIHLGNNTRTVLFISAYGSPIIQGSYPIATKDWYNSYILNNSLTINTPLYSNFTDLIAELLIHTRSKRKMR